MANKDNTENFNLTINSPYILYVGARWKYKNFDTLIETFGFNKSILNNYKLVLFGGGKLKQNEIELMKKHNINLNKLDPTIQTQPTIL